MNTTDLVATRRSLHAVAELLLAGPQYRRTGTIRLRATPGGFGTTTEPDLRVEGGELVAGGERLPLSGRSFQELGIATGAGAGAPENLYSDGSGATPDDVPAVEPAAAELLAHALTLGDRALRAFAPDATPVLWPEHFDLSITVDRVNYGVSLGDGYLDVPYAYVGPWEPRGGDFWNAPFGAAHPLTELGEDAAALTAFFAEGRKHATT
ncbi:hypothetical protein Sme01_45350 [Sphaerisporangium melleum]|uniref:Uncharacterized protein n=1 Tax=Sphaerisporangium melleum TaxID=321316 RepID=A0A917VH35_9ACTN|nr:hypothetical protein [Sphaerisporangium melleum]GGK80328.1 hypothetical protein GCM10007964_23730 [Sphaerisporangium melleum]GII72059.1 hypothetical protein Sme01_45350 [Sphaerisporangium melleum]